MVLKMEITIIIVIVMSKQAVKNAMMSTFPEESMHYHGDFVFFKKNCCIFFSQREMNLKQHQLKRG